MPLYNKIQPMTINAVIMAGQSNEAGGLGLGTPSATYLSSQPYTWIFDKSNDRSSTNNGRIENLLYGRNQNWDSAHYTSNGPEMTCGYDYFQATGNPLLIIKYAQGGSGLVDDGSTTNTNGLWQIDADSTRANNLLHYTILVQYFIIPCVQMLNAKGITVNIKAIHWCQGENDANNQDQADNYETELTRLLNQLETDLTPYNCLDANFKPIISRIRDSADYSPARPYAGTVRTAQANVASAFGGYLIDTDAYARFDNLHYTAAAQETHGSAVCTNLLLI